MAISKQLGLQNVLQQASSTNHQHEGMELSEGKFAKSYDPFQGDFYEIHLKKSFS